MSSITTYTGKHFDPACPDRDKIDIRDIAHALSLTCRGNGQVKTFFSVGQHCIHCALEAEARGYGSRLALACLLHDASECYLSDVPKPIKATMPQYRDVEERLLEQIYCKYLGEGLTDEEEQRVKRIDKDMLYYDLLYLLNEKTEENAPVMATDFSYEVLPFEQVERRYLELYARLREATGEGRVFSTDYFELYYNRVCEELVGEITGTLQGNMQRIMEFFQLKKLERKIHVVIYADTEAYAAHVKECGQDYYEWMIADTFDGRINVLSLKECRRCASHAGMDREEYARLIVHEFVHICQQQVEPDCDGCIWFWEALATNLAGQVMTPVEIRCSREDLMDHYHSLPAPYAISYRLGKYMLEHLPYEQIYGYIRNPRMLREDTGTLLEQAGQSAPARPE